jgi:hypothetical protein
MAKRPAVAPAASMAVASSAATIGTAEFSEAAFGDATFSETAGQDTLLIDAFVEGGPVEDPFADTDRDWSKGEVIEVREPSTTSWFDDLDTVTAELPPQQKR